MVSGSFSLPLFVFASDGCAVMREALGSRIDAGFIAGLPGWWLIFSVTAKPTELLTEDKKD